MIVKSAIVILCWISCANFPVVGSRAEAQSLEGAFAPKGIVSSGDPSVPTIWPWSSIGRVNVIWGSSARSHCTGTLVGPRHVLTAAHCLFNPLLNSWLKPTQVHFVAGQTRDGKFIGDSAAAELKINPAAIEAWPRWDRVPIHMVQLDWAIVLLENPIALRPLSVRAIRSAHLPSGAGPGVIARAGYSEDRPYALSIHHRCSAKTDVPQPDAISHQCDSLPGDSGSPLLLIQGNEASLVGIATSVITRGMDRTPLAAFGVSASAFAEAVSMAVGTAE